MVYRNSALRCFASLTQADVSSQGQSLRTGRLRACPYDSRVSPLLNHATEERTVIMKVLR